MSMAEPPPGPPGPPEPPTRQLPPPEDRGTSPWLVALVVVIAVAGGLALGALVIGGGNDTKTVTETRTAAVRETTSAPSTTTNQVTVTTPERTTTRTVTVTVETTQATSP